MLATSDFYLARAAQCQKEAGEAALSNVRDICLRSEKAWRAMADRQLLNESERKLRTDRDAPNGDPS